MGGTRYHPGTHLRIVNEMAIAKYQNILGQKSIVCKPGTIGIFHSGLWHGAGVNFSENIRYMFKVRLQPTEKQELLWDPEKNINLYQTVLCIGLMKLRIKLSMIF